MLFAELSEKSIENICYTVVVVVAIIAVYLYERQCKKK